MNLKVSIISVLCYNLESLYVFGADAGSKLKFSIHKSTLSVY